MTDFMTTNRIDVNSTYQPMLVQNKQTKKKAGGSFNNGFIM